jgi:hypothetical protein
MLTKHFRSLLTDWSVALDSKWQAADHRNLAYRRLTAQIGEMCGYRVNAGPYKGMKYFGAGSVPVVDRSPTPRFIGSFEQEIHPWIESIIAESPQQIVHIGGGSGYHAVGMALRVPEAASIVFDTLIPARKACVALARQNCVDDRLEIRGYCGTEGMLDVDLAGALVFCDCGGAEINILDPDRHPLLRLATIIVETHDALDNRITPALRQRFAKTHKIEFKSAIVRDPLKYPLLAELAPSAAQMALDEERSVTADGRPQAWALLRPYSS